MTPSLRWVAFLWFVAGYAWATAFWRGVARIGDSTDWWFAALATALAVTDTWVWPWALRTLRTLRASVPRGKRARRPEGRKP